MRAAPSLLALLVFGACPDFPEQLLHADRSADQRAEARVDRASELDLGPAERRRDGRADVGPPDRPPDVTHTDAAPPGSWVTVPAGTFQMGSPPTEPCNGNNETLHSVKLTHPFEISNTEVTQAEFLKVLGYSPATLTACGTRCPVETISWHEAAAYCNGLSALAALAPCYSCAGSAPSVVCVEAGAYAQSKLYDCPGYRLPSEAEWEYAYRAGTTTALYSGPITSNCNKTDPNADAIAWYESASTHPVGNKAANAWGLYDMAGNVWEWTNDLYVSDLGGAGVTDPWGGLTGSQRVRRGGGFSSGLRDLRAARRAGDDPAIRANNIGFRCVRTK